MVSSKLACESKRHQLTSQYKSCILSLKSPKSFPKHIICRLLNTVFSIIFTGFFGLVDPESFGFRFFHEDTKGKQLFGPQLHLHQLLPVESDPSRRGRERGGSQDLSLGFVDLSES